MTDRKEVSINKSNIDNPQQREDAIYQVYHQILKPGYFSECQGFGELNYFLYELLYVPLRHVVYDKRTKEAKDHMKALHKLLDAAVEYQCAYYNLRARITKK